MTPDELLYSFKYYAFYPIFWHIEMNGPHYKCGCQFSSPGRAMFQLSEMSRRSESGRAGFESCPCQHFFSTDGSTFHLFSAENSASSSLFSRFHYTTFTLHLRRKCSFFWFTLTFFCFILFIFLVISFGFICLFFVIQLNLLLCESFFVLVVQIYYTLFIYLLLFSFSLV